MGGNSNSNSNGHLPSTDVLAAFDHELSETDLQEKRKLTEAGRQYTLHIAKYLASIYKDTNMNSSSSQSSPTKKPSGVETEDEEGDNDDTEAVHPGSQLMVITGTSDVHTHTVSHLRTMFKCYNSPLLNELRGGDFQGYRMDDIQILHPEEFRYGISYLSILPITFQPLFNYLSITTVNSRLIPTQILTQTPSLIPSLTSHPPLFPFILL